MFTPLVSGPEKLKNQRQKGIYFTPPPRIQGANMPNSAQSNPDLNRPFVALARPFAPEDEVALRESLKRCSPSTFEAAVQFRKTGNPEHMPAVVIGVIERFVEPDLRVKLKDADDDLRLIEDLGIDSLTMMEIVILVEDVLQMTINNDELRNLRTVGDVKTFIDCKIRGLPLPKPTKFMPIEGIGAVMPIQPPFLFLNEASVSSTSANGKYKISGQEFFLQGHFKDNPVLPASIMLEALGQLAVLFLLKAKRPELTAPVAAARIFFTACDGVRCQRVCKPGDLLSLVVKPKRIKHPLAIFEGHITCGNDRVAFAEEIALTFDFMRPEELAAAEPAGENSATVAPSPRQSEMSVNLPR